jgi:hypothetical protein
MSKGRIHELRHQNARLTSPIIIRTPANQFEAASGKGTRRFSGFSKALHGEGIQASISSTANQKNKYILDTKVDDFRSDLQNLDREQIARHPLLRPPIVDCVVPLRQIHGVKVVFDATIVHPVQRQPSTLSIRIEISCDPLVGVSQVGDCVVTFGRAGGIEVVGLGAAERAIKRH